MIRITQLADAVSTLQLAKVVRKTIIFKVARDLTGVLPLQGNIFDHVVLKSMAVNGWHK